MSNKVILLLFVLSTILVAASAAVTTVTKEPATGVDISAQKKPDNRRAQREANALEKTDYIDYESIDTLDPEYLDDIEHFDEDSIDEADRYSSKKKPSRHRRRRRPRVTKPSGKSKKPQKLRSRRRRRRLGNERKTSKGGERRSRRERRRRNPHYSTTKPTTTKPSPTTRPRSTQPSTKPTEHVGGQNDKYPPQCKCRRLPNRGGICYDMKNSKRMGRCKRRNCDRSYECVTGGGRKLKNCYRRFAFEEVQVMYSYKGMHKCKRVKFKMPKVFYSPYY